MDGTASNPNFGPDAALDGLPDFEPLDFDNLMGMAPSMHKFYLTIKHFRALMCKSECRFPSLAGFLSQPGSTCLDANFSLSNPEAQNSAHCIDDVGNPIRPDIQLRQGSDPFIVGAGLMGGIPDGDGIYMDVGPSRTTRPATKNSPQEALLSHSGRVSGGSSGEGEPASSGAPPSMRGSGSKKAVGSEKISAIQEKNRRAQKRFRERQKAKMKDMTEQLDEMGAELGNLRVENNSLKNRNSVLEKVLTLRDEHIRTLQNEQHIFDVCAPAGRTDYPVIVGRSQSDKALCASEESSVTEYQTATKPSGNWASLNCEQWGIDLTNPETIRNLSAETVIDKWKQIVRELGGLLVEIDDTSGDNAQKRNEAATKRMYEVLDIAGRMCMHTAVLHPTNMQKLISATLDDGRSGASPENQARWMALTAELQLAEEQKGQLVALRQMFVQRMGKIMQSRRQILTQLRTVSVPNRLIALQSIMSETMKVDDATKALRFNLQEEHLCGLEFIGTVLKTILTPMQKAKAIVQSYPFYPDVFQIASSVAAERGDASEDICLLTDGTSGEDASGCNGVSSTAFGAPA